MNLCKVLMLLWVAVAPLSFAAEVLESMKTREGREYFKVEVLTTDDVGIRIRHEAGTARIPYEDLPDTLQSKYRAEKRKAALMKIEATNAETERIKQKEEKEKQALLEEKTKPPVKPGPAPTASVPDADSEVHLPAEDSEVVKLDASIADMKGRTSTAAAEANELRKKAGTERSKTRSVVTGYDKRGKATRKLVADKSGWVKATQYEEQAVALENQVQKARFLISEMEAKRIEMTGEATP